MAETNEIEKKTKHSVQFMLKTEYTTSCLLYTTIRYSWKKKPTNKVDVC